jgi:hypothetical protein
MENRNLADLTGKEELVKTFPVWMDNFVFSPRVFSTEYPYNSS